MTATRGAKSGAKSSAKSGAKSSAKTSKTGDSRSGAKQSTRRTHSASRIEPATERDEQALDSRIAGSSFVKIARQLQFPTASDALAAYRRALRRRTTEEQASIKAGERKRLDAMERALRADAQLAPDARATRLARIERLRAALA